MEMMQHKQFNEISWPGNLNIIFTKPHMVQFAGFKAKVDLFIEKQNYIVKLPEVNGSSNRLSGCAMMFLSANCWGKRNYSAWISTGTTGNATI